jgi:hypothetical protein
MLHLKVVLDVPSGGAASLNLATHFFSVRSPYLRRLAVSDRRNPNRTGSTALSAVSSDARLRSRTHQSRAAANQAAPIIQ